MPSPNSIKIYADKVRQQRYKAAAKAMGLTLSDWGRRELDKASDSSQSVLPMKEAV